MEDRLALYMHAADAGQQTSLAGRMQQPYVHDRSPFMGRC